MFKRKTIVYVLSGVLVLFMGIVIISGMTANRAVMTNADVNWGLSFNTPDGIPTGNAGADELKKYNAFYTGNTSEQRTFARSILSHDTIDLTFMKGMAEVVYDCQLTIFLGKIPNLYHNLYFLTIE